MTKYFSFKSACSVFDSALSWAERVVDALQCRQQWELVWRKQQPKKNKIETCTFLRNEYAGSCCARLCWHSGAGAVVGQWRRSADAAEVLEHLNISSFYCPDDHCDCLEAGKINTLKSSACRFKCVLTGHKTFKSIYVRNQPNFTCKSILFIERQSWRSGNTPCAHGVTPTKALISLHSELKEEKLFKPRTMTRQLLTLELSHNALLPDHRHSISFNIKSTQTIISHHIWSRAEWKGNDYNLLRWLNSPDLSAIKVS